VQLRTVPVCRREYRVSAAIRMLVEWDPGLVTTEDQMHRDCEQSAWRGMAFSAAGVIVAYLGASLVRRWWQRPAPQTSGSSAETADAAVLTIAVGAMVDEGAPAGTAS
jgi:hypothetical protein